MSESKELREVNVPDRVGVISMQDFLQFLKISCQVNESIMSPVSALAKNPKTNFNYDQLAKNELVNNLMRKYKAFDHKSDNYGSKETEDIDTNKKKEIKRRRSLHKTISLKSKLDSTESIHRLNPSLTNKLDEVLNEGILDSFLPFICQSQSNSNVPKTTTTLTVTPASNTNNGNANSSVNSTTASNAAATANNPSTSTSNSKTKLTAPTANQKPQPIVLSVSSDSRKGSISSEFSFNKSIRKKSVSPIVLDTRESEPELTIHVCDEVKNISKDFTCPQKLLVSKMGYFADITSGQRLSEMDISVHCDLEIFDWLIRWIKKDTKSQEIWPKLDPNNVVPILVSASFLQMEPLLLECLSYCHAKLSDVIKVSPNMACLNDNIISRLADLFTNLELEMVKDKKDRIQPRLWTKMIQSLCEPEPQSLRGHYATLSNLFRCQKCGKYCTTSVASYVHCVSQNMKLNRWGQIVSSHVRDVNWNLTNYVANLYKELRSWRKVYWRLWGMCHFLYCIACETHFPACQMQWCLYHPEPSQFLGPSCDSKVGRFPCCGQLAYRYESITGSSGCQYREHTVVPQNDRDRSILNLVNVAAENNSMIFEPAPIKQVTVSSDTWWSGISILPNRSRQGILPTLHVDDARPHHNRKFLARQSHSMLDSSSETESSEYSKVIPIRQDSSSSSDEGEESEYSSPPVQYNKSSQKRRVRVGYGRNWSGELSARSNQDNQREFEERAMKQIVSIVGKRTGIDQNQNLQYSQGGTYIKLENEWRENVGKTRTVNTKNNKSNK